MDRLNGSIELDPTSEGLQCRSNGVVMELQRTHGAKVKTTWEIETEAEDGFDEANIGVVRDNARQLKFRVDSTGFE